MFRERQKSKLLWGFFLRPIFPFACEYLLLAPLVLGVDLPQVGPLYLFLAPWIVLVVALLNLPLLGSMFRLFRMDAATRRNHALEHATIHFLRADGLRRSAGKASPDGFRLSGGASPDQIRRAFARVAELVDAGEPLPHVSRYCGSNRITALALALVMLVLAAAASLVLRPSLSLRAGMLGAIVLAFVAMRHTVGNWIQKRFFMATDFGHVTILDVRKLKADMIEQPPVYFVATRIA